MLSRLYFERILRQFERAHDRLQKEGLSLFGKDGICKLLEEVNGYVGAAESKAYLMQNKPCPYQFSEFYRHYTFNDLGLYWFRNRYPESNKQRFLLIEAIIEKLKNELKQIDDA